MCASLTGVLHDCTRRLNLSLEFGIFNTLLRHTIVIIKLPDLIVAVRIINFNAIFNP